MNPSLSVAQSAGRGIIPLSLCIAVTELGAAFSLVTARLGLQTRVAYMAGLEPEDVRSHALSIEQVTVLCQAPP